MIIRDYESARELVNAMNVVGKRIWIAVDDPINRLLRVVDEHLKYCYGIRLSDLKATGDQLNIKELEALKSTGNRWELIKDLEISEQQKFLLSEFYLKGMANYLSEKYKAALVDSPLRVNSTLKLLDNNLLSILPVDLRKKACGFDINDKDFKLLSTRKLYTPLFEYSAYCYKEYDHIFDVNVKDFINEKSIYDKEKELYEKIIKKCGPEVDITLLERMPLTVSPVPDWAEKKAGFYMYELIGVGIELNKS